MGLPINSPEKAVNPLHMSVKMPPKKHGQPVFLHKSIGCVMDQNLGSLTLLVLDVHLEPMPMEIDQ